MSDCQKCGQPTEADATFCGNCGQRLPASPRSEPRPQAANQDQVSSSRSVPPLITGNSQDKDTPATGNAVIPAYAKEPIDRQARKAEIQAIIALLFGVIAIPVALFLPLAALVFGTSGVVLGTIARSKNKHPLTLIAVVISTVGLLAGITVWSIIVSKNPAIKLAQGNNAPTSTVVAVDTPCYNVSIDSGLKNYYPKLCNFDASSSAEEVSVNAIDNTSITSSNLSAVAASLFQRALTGTGESYISGSSGTFANSPAYIVYAANPNQNTQAIFAMVVHSSQAPDNIYIIGRAIRTIHQPAFGRLESNWQWK